ncbi:ABC transporter substrate-binding protein [Candidatus Bathyarchaeota archaeon]|nr:ABC transporter substrate-binding protein [Candidatus Bathyarchaeota archaeon]
MKLRASTIIVLGFVLLLNMGLLTYTYRAISTFNKYQGDNNPDLKELRERVENLTSHVEALTKFLESKYGTIPSLRNIDSNTPSLLLKDGIVKIGVITSTSNAYDDYEKYVREIIEIDVNTYVQSLGSELDFIFEVADAQGQAARHLEIVQEMNEDGIRLIIGGMWSSQVCASRSYCYDNDIILFSPSSTSPLLSIEDDTIFRLAPTDFEQGAVIARMLESRDINAVIVIQRGDGWGDGIYKSLEIEFNKSGGVIVNRIRYRAETMDFTEYLQDAEEIAKEAVSNYGEKHVAIELISFAESVELVRQLKDYPTLYDLKWFGSDGTVHSQQMIKEVPEKASRIGLNSPVPEAEKNDRYNDLALRYKKYTGEDLNFYTACSYDIAMILAKAIVEVNTLEINALKQAIMEVSNGYRGVTGLCDLDKYGEREKASYCIYKYGVKDGEYGCWKSGFCSDLGIITWKND